jgi:hypothetical protein
LPVLDVVIAVASGADADRGLGSFPRSLLLPQESRAIDSFVEPGALQQAPELAAQARFFGSLIPSPPVG